ncbi:hypothetical protein AYO44_02710 [Planctomycetaceae bacterium SCGC AG-212-F19]|nr:hypothetical protein AYO44_02710 [Planctomycetaceae bacterium SCGC AG-212-F19]
MQEGKPRQTTEKGSSSKSKPDAGPPQVTASIARVKLNWKDRQQTFDLVLSNTGDKTAIVHAIVYGANDTVNPPRRGVSPATASAWFTLANSKDGQLTSVDIERAWKAEAFASARGGRLRKSWDVKIEPGITEVVEASHDLDDKSPHPQYKGKVLPNVGYTEYRVWLFTAEGQCFFEQTVPAFGPPPPPRETKKLPDTKVADTKPAPETKSTRPLSPLEAEADKELKLAISYLERNRIQDAKDKLIAILKKYPDTESAKSARKLLKDLM